MKRDIKTYCKALKKAVDIELSREKSYGCVSYYSNGSHDDMDYKTILLSIESITNDIIDTNWDKIDNFYDLRNLGLKIENNMFKKTGGINTYKGLIFLQCFLIYAWIKNISWEESKFFIKNLSLPLQNDYLNIKKAILFDKHKVKDIRQIPLSGYKSIFELIDLLEKDGWPVDIISIFLISVIDDTTTIKRSSIKRLRELQNLADQAFKAWKSKDLKTYHKLSHKLNQIYLSEKISSGGVADVLTTIMTLRILRRNNDY